MFYLKFTNVFNDLAVSHKLFSPPQPFEPAAHHLGSACGLKLLHLMSQSIIPISEIQYLINEAKTC